MILKNIVLFLILALLCGCSHKGRKLIGIVVLNKLYL